MSTNKKTSSQARRSPVGNRKPKPKTPKAAKNQHISNGLHEFVPEPPQRSSSSSLGKEEVAKINLKTVCKLDSSVQSIQFTVPQVVLYKYEGILNTWVGAALCY